MSDIQTQPNISPIKAVLRFLLKRHVKYHREPCRVGFDCEPRKFCSI